MTITEIDQFATVLNRSKPTTLTGEGNTKNIEHFAKVFIALFGAGAWEFARRVMNKIEEIDNADSQ